jgi:hypothetical protein
MFIWILALVLFALFAAIGYMKGAIRMAVSLFGLFVALLLALPLSPMVQPLVPLVGLKNPVWSWLLPPVIVFFVLSGIFIAVSFFVHRKVELHYKYKTDDVQRLRWERLNQRLGICMGLVAGIAYLVIIGIVVFVLGYCTVQLSADESDPGLIKFLNKTRADLHETGLDRVVSKFDPAPPLYYEAADILGLIYHNPLLHNRLGNYPPFIGLAERPEFQEITNDADLMNKFQTKTSVAELVKEPKIQAILSSPEISAELQKIDLRVYLETGKSPKFDDEKILGRWQVDTEAVITSARKRKPDMTGAELAILKRVASSLSRVIFIATVDNKAIVKESASAEQAAPAEAAPEATGDAAAAQPEVPQAGTFSPEMVRRYGLAGGARPSAPAAAAPAPTAAAPPSVQPPPLIFSGEGEWKNEGGTYKITITDSNGKQHEFMGIATDDELTVTLGSQTLIFYRME